MPGQLSHTAADILRCAAIVAGLGTSPEDQGEWPIYADDEPNNPDNCITCMNDVGRTGDRDGPTGTRDEFFGVQFRIRAVDKQVAGAKASAVAIALDSSPSFSNVVVTVPGGAPEKTYTLDSVIRSGSPTPLGREEPTSERPVYVINCLASLYQNPD